MFGRFRQARRDKAIGAALYGAIVAQARAPALYARLGVPDTVDGRFQMVVLHLALVLRRLKTGGDAGKATGQEMFDLFCGDMDRSLRELGVGDLVVPKRMRKMAEAFYGRSAAYDAALDRDGGVALEEALGRNVFGDEASAAGRALAGYVLASAEGLANADVEVVLAGRPPFPDPASFAEYVPG